MVFESALVTKKHYCHSLHMKLTTHSEKPHNYPGVYYRKKFWHFETSTKVIKIQEIDPQVKFSESDWKPFL